MAIQSFTVARRRILPLYSYASCGKDADGYSDGSGLHWEQQPDGSWLSDEGERRGAEEIRVMR